MFNNEKNRTMIKNQPSQSNNQYDINYDSQRNTPLRTYEPSNRKYKLGDRLCSIQLPSNYLPNAKLNKDLFNRAEAVKIKLNQESTNYIH